MGADVTLLCAPALQRLFAGSLDVSVLAASGEVELPDPDYWAMAGSLAWRLAVTPETVPAAPYLRPVSAGPALGGGFKVGLMTRGNPAHGNNANRSLPAAAAARLAALPAQVIED